MATLKPFSCIRPNPALAASVAALPYDVYSSAEARAFVAAHPLSFLAIDRPETAFPEDTDLYAPEVYAKAGSLLEDWISNGIFAEDKEKCYYLYELTSNNRIQTGITACVSIDDYFNNVVKRHEHTRSDKELDRFRHIQACHAQTGPIFLTYQKNQAIQNIVNMAKQEIPLYDFISEDGVHHRVFRISKPEWIQRITQEFSSIDRIYIADGHHRAASAAKAGLSMREAAGAYDGTEEFNYFLSVLFPDEELKIMDYNRLVKDLNGLSNEEFLLKLKELCEVTPLPALTKPGKKGEFTMYLADTWYRCRFKDTDRKDPVECLDVSLLQNQILSPVLNIQDPKTDNRIDFAGGIRGLQELERRCHLDCQAAFAMYPTSIHELFAVADADRLMPPKSTWFEPKLRSGLFIHRI